MLSSIIAALRFAGAGFTLGAGGEATKIAVPGTGRVGETIGARS
jgi:hypothetical protein